MRSSDWPKNEAGIDLSLLKICEDLHDWTTGSSDCLTREDADKYDDALRHAMKHWRFSERTYDAAVYLMCRVTCDDYLARVEYLGNLGK